MRDLGGPSAPPPDPAAPADQALLTLTGVHSGYDRREIIRGVSLTVRPAEIVAMIGPNGAGKSTLLKTIFGFLPPSAGEIRLAGEPIGGRTPPEVLRRGICYVMQGYSILPNLTVEENLELGAYIRTDRGVRGDVERLLDLFPILRERRRQRARVLSGGERRMLEIARVLLLAPRLVLLDEPTIGLAPSIIDEVYRIVQDLRRRGIALLIVEQNARTALRHADRAYVLEQGRVRFEGSGEEILHDPEVQRAYLGSAGGV
ncbi:MAG: ABC transporter ATP-binding protein [Armatimonadota bacterium]|nr:ABC transporter ATP-binding protein [Armatimonadota bacterium]MDR7451643.1 ABC transporter ATP-binding protein [Armatimonadota bacterium]MDR7467637.1 ABC transporter ATP-binding protein [Armatimonadota bacterium]MDR7492612.1 ABC transporter ATP-binding protein [Armatimonadota bacterium]MDR7499920.1 ABC transporter ATP-binding protein [Armatimonadota bacterium]